MGTHMNNIKRANQTLGFVKRNIRVHNKDLKSTAYKTLVRPQLEYASTVWSPHTASDINKVESVQRRAARWVTRDYRCTSNITAMLKDLNWRPLDQWRINSRLVLLYKVTYDHVAIYASDYIKNWYAQSWSMVVQFGTSQVYFFKKNLRRYRKWQLDLHQATTSMKLGV